MVLLLMGYLYLFIHRPYEIWPSLEKGRRSRHPFHRYNLNDFERQTDKDGTQFFGFQSSKRSFFSNVVVLAFGCLVAYYALPHLGIFRAIYTNTALSTVALAFGFLMADQAVPLALKWLVCVLSRLRRRILGFWQHVKA